MIVKWPFTFNRIVRAVWGTLQECLSPMKVSALLHVQKNKNKNKIKSQSQDVTDNAFLSIFRTSQISAVGIYLSSTWPTCHGREWNEWCGTSLRLRLHGRGFQSKRFHDLETASKTTRFRSVYKEPIQPFTSWRSRSQALALRQLDMGTSTKESMSSCRSFPFDERS